MPNGNGRTYSVFIDSTDDLPEVTEENPFWVILRNLDEVNENRKLLDKASLILVGKFDHYDELYIGREHRNWQVKP